MQSRFHQVLAELGGEGSEHNGVVVAYGGIGFTVAGETGSPEAAVEISSFQFLEHKVMSIKWQ